MAAAREGRDTEKLVEGWLHQLSPKEVKKRGFQHSSDSWALKYYVLRRVKESVHLDIYKKPPKKDELSKESLHLASYQVNKRTDANKYKQYVCELLVNDTPSFYSFETEERRDSFVFFLQTQKRLQDDITGTTFSVKPEDSPDQRKIGARGSVCYLHVCSAGLTLALQVSRSIIAQWPLKCIRWYASSDKGQFVFEAGRRAPMGEGRYTFDTHVAHDTQLYDLLDKYVMDANNLWQAHSSDEFIEKKIFEDYCSLRLLALGFADMVFSRHLMRLSTCNFEDLAMPPTMLPLGDAAASQSSSSATRLEAAERDVNVHRSCTSAGAGPTAAAELHRSQAVSQNASNFAKASMMESHLRLDDQHCAAGRNKENYMDMASSRAVSCEGGVVTPSAIAQLPLERWCILSSSPTKPFERGSSFAADSPKRYVRTPSDSSQPPPVQTDSYENTQSIAEGPRANLRNVRVMQAGAQPCPPAIHGAPVRSLSGQRSSGDLQGALAGVASENAVPQRKLLSTSDYLYEPSCFADETLLFDTEPQAAATGAKDAYEEVTDLAELRDLQLEDARTLVALGQAPPVPSASRPLRSLTGDSVKSRLQQAHHISVGSPVTMHDQAGADQTKQRRSLEATAGEVAIMTGNNTGVQTAAAAASPRKQEVPTTVSGAIHVPGIRKSPASVVFTKAKKSLSASASPESSVSVKGV